MNKNKRKKHYINPDIQKRLIINLVIIELVLISLTTLWLYMDISQLIENNMYKIHIKNTLSVEFFAVRFAEAAFVLLIINFLIASLVIWYWRDYINRITSQLNEVADAMQKLDFTFKFDVYVEHEVSRIALNWFNQEKQTLSDIRRFTSMIDMEKPDEITDILTNCKQLLNRSTPP